MRFEFQNLEFEDSPDAVLVRFLKRFQFTLSKKDLKRIGEYALEKNAIVFLEDKDESEKDNESIANHFNSLLSQGFSHLTGLFSRQAIYVHQHSNIPLIGNLGFGIVDRNTNALELKPITDCNLDCVFCSVDEGKSSKKIVDFVVEADYLIEETKKLLEFKETTTSLHINPHGEPLIYADIIALVRGISELKNAGLVVIYTNGSLLNEKLIDDLHAAGLGRLSISLHSLDEKKAGELARGNYSVKHVIEMIDYARKNTDMEIILSPVYVPKLNESDIEEIIKFGKERGLVVTIQNFLNYKLGRNPSKQIDFDKFFIKLDEWEKKYDTKLTVNNDPRFSIEKTKKLPVPFKTGDIISAMIVCPGRYPREMIASAKDRNIVVPDCNLSVGEKVNLRIEKSKDNLFIGTLAKGKGKDIKSTSRRR